MRERSHGREEEKAEDMAKKTKAQILKLGHQHDARGQGNRGRRLQEQLANDKRKYLQAHINSTERVLNMLPKTLSQTVNLIVEAEKNFATYKNTEAELNGKINEKETQVNELKESITWRQEKCKYCSREPQTE